HAHHSSHTLFRPATHPPFLHSFPTRRSSDLHDDELPEIRQVVAERCADIPPEDLEVLGYREFVDGLERGVAAHHAGMLPAFKERSEEHTSELQSRFDLVCRLLLDKQNHRSTY